MTGHPIPFIKIIELEENENKEVKFELQSEAINVIQ